MRQQQSSFMPALARWLAFTAFGAIAIVTLGIFLWNGGKLASAVIQEMPMVTIHTGVLRLLGIALLAAVLASALIISAQGKPSRNEKADRKIVRLLIAGLVILFLFPPAVHIPLERYLFSQSYKICQPKSTANRAYRVVVYVADVPTCFKN